MGESGSLKRLKHPPKIRERSNTEIKETLTAYQNIYKMDPFLANMMLLHSELSEYIPIPLGDEEKVKTFIKENSDFLVKQYVKRFKSIDERAIPPDYFGVEKGV